MRNLVLSGIELNCCLWIASRVTVARSRDESKEDKKARKQAVKAERQNRRAEKKTTKQEFNAAIKQQTQILAGKDIKTRKL